MRSPENARKPQIDPFDKFRKNYENQRTVNKISEMPGSLLWHMVGRPATGRWHTLCPHPALSVRTRTRPRVPSASSVDREWARGMKSALLYVTKVAKPTACLIFAGSVAGWHNASPELPINTCRAEMHWLFTIISLDNGLSPDRIRPLSEPMLATQLKLPRNLG